MRFTVAHLDSCFSFLLRVFHTANFNEIRTEVCIIGDRGQRASPLCLVIVAVEIFMRDLPLKPMYTLYAHSNGHHFHGAVSPPENFHFIPFFLLSSSPRLFHSISIFLFFFRDKLRDLRGRNINQCESREAGIHCNLAGGSTASGVSFIEYADGTRVTVYIRTPGISMESGIG